VHPLKARTHRIGFGGTNVRERSDSVAVPKIRGASANQAFWIAAGVLSVLSLLLRLWGIDRSTLWLDEVFTVDAVTMPVADLVAERLANTHSPAFFLLLKALPLPTDSLFWLRLPSAVFGALTVFVGALAGRALSDARAGLFAALVLATMPMLIAYGQEARSYTSLLLGVTVALWGAARIVRHPRLAAASLGSGAMARRRSGILALRMAWGALLAGCLWAVYMMTLGLFFWASLVAAFLFLFFTAPARYGRLARPFLRVQIVYVLLTIPLLAALASAIHSVAGAYFTEAPDFRQIYATTTNAFLFQFDDDRGIIWSQLPQTPDAWAGIRNGLLVGLVVLAAVAGIAGLRRRTGALAITLAAFLVPLIIIAFVSLNTPLWITRYLLVSTPAFCLILGAGLSTLARGWAGRAVVAVLFLVLILQLWAFEHRDRRNWGPLVAASATLKDHAILVPSWIQQAEIRHEWRRQGLPAEPPVVAGLEYAVPDFTTNVPPLAPSEAGSLRPDTTYILVWYAPESRAELAGRASCTLPRENGLVEVFPPVGGRSALCEGR